MRIPFSYLSYDNDEIIVYGILQELFWIKGGETRLIHPNCILYQINHSRLPTKKEKTELKETLEKLCKHNVIENNQFGYILNTDIFNFEEGTHFITYTSEVFHMLMSEPKLLKHYLYIIGLRDYRTKICDKPINYFVKVENLSDRTIKTYNKKLEDLKLIYISRNGINLQYVLYEDKNILEANSNWMRSISAKYNRFIKSPGVFNAKEIDELYSEVIKYNERCELLGKSSPDYKLRKKSLEPIDEFKSGVTMLL